MLKKLVYGFTKKVPYTYKNATSSFSFNGMLNLIYQETKYLRRNKNENDYKNRSHSYQGWMMGLEPTTLGTTIRCSTN